VVNTFFERNPFLNIPMVQESEFYGSTPFSFDYIWLVGQWRFGKWAQLENMSEYNVFENRVPTLALAHHSA